MDTIGGFDDNAVNMLDLDVASTGTQRSKVFHNVRRRGSLSVELRITGVTTANLTLRILGQNTAPANDTARLLPLSLDVPDLSALTADYTGVFLLPIYTAYFQIEVQSTSGAVHAKVDVLGTDAAFDDSAKGSGAATTVTLSGALPAGSNKIGSVDVAANSMYVDTITAADASAHAYGTSQVVKTPVFVRAHRLMAGTVTVFDGTRVAGVVLYGGDPLPLHCTNLNQITYQFSQTGTNEKLHLSAGI